MPEDTDSFIRALRSAYGKSPYWDYYADFFSPFYTRETKWLLDLNEGLHDVIVRLLHNNPNEQLARLARTTTFMQADLEQYWGNGTSILDTLMENGPIK